MNPQPSVKEMVERISRAASDLPPEGPLQPEARNQLQDLVKQLGFALETSLDTLNRLVFSPFQHAVVRIAINLSLFEYLIEAGPNGKTLNELTTKTGVDPNLMRPSPPFDFVGPVFQKMPEFLAKNDYRFPTAYHGPFQATYDTEMSGYDYIMEPRWADTLTDCNLFMKGRREGGVSWLEFYPFADNVLTDADTNPDAVTVVDVGGGLGHGLTELKDKFPELKGRLILQDLPKTIEHAGDGEGIFEPTAHDFFTPQPVQGSKAYLIRQVLHDWPDQECQAILKHLAAAMRAGYSKLLVNEIIIPEVGASDFIIACDLVMMGLGGGMERTKSHWSSLLESAGLRIQNVWTLNEQTESVMEAVLI
ncbi:MAG: hypothetical protein LQ344_005724 [Seirophora lacunosa]|nr:MAG: hypothetical protein LQ344_005724 [Seirophora lacunosa]